MGNQYRRMQTVKHALQYYITRPGASEKDLVREKNLLKRVEEDIEWYEERHHIKKKVTRKVVALNTRTNDPLFTVEGKISLDSDEDGDLNVTIKTGKGKYKLFYAHLSNDVTYTCIQTKAKKENPYAYDIQFFPAKEVIENGVIDIKSSE